MLRQKKLIREGDWDNLLLLDACRYDYFERVYTDYLEGGLSKLKSIGSRTIDWLRGTFDKSNFQDTVYVSSNPHVNSKVPQKRFDGLRYFAKIVDVWDWGWDEVLGTVPPEAVNKGVKSSRESSEKRILAHYIQPHWPYVNLDWESSESNGGKQGGLSSPVSPDSFISFFGEEAYVEFGKLVRDIVGWKNAYKMARFIGLIEPREIENFAKEKGRRRLREEYEENLRLVLEKASDLAKDLEGKTVITADHGEFLGEHDLYGHHYRCDSPILKEVPWLEVKK